MHYKDGITARRKQKEEGITILTNRSAAAGIEEGYSKVVFGCMGFLISYMLSLTGLVLMCSV